MITPRATFALWESRISPNAYGAKCEGCRHQHGVCLGLRRDYLERYGDEEVRPEYVPDRRAGTERGLTPRSALGRSLRAPRRRRRNRDQHPRPPAPTARRPPE